MKRIIAVLSMGLSLVCLAVPAIAANVADLYEAQVPVSGEDTNSRNQAIAEALGRVLVKVTGREPAPGYDELAPQAARYVQQYRYRRDVTAEGEVEPRLWVRFDKTGLDRVLRDQGLPVWGSSRPGILVWLGTETAGRRSMVGVEAGLAAALHAAAAERGLPVQLPLLDLEDQARLSSADLWSDYAPAVQHAAERYSQPLVLTGRLRQVSPDHWNSRWTLYEASRRHAIQANAADAATAVRQAIAQVAELLAARYAPTGGQGGPETVRVRVIGVGDLQDYARTLKLLAEREVVERISVRSAEGDSLVLEVLARGGREALAQVLDLVGALTREPDPQPSFKPVPVFEPVSPPQPVPAPEPAPVAGSDQPAVEPGGTAVAPAQPSAPTPTVVEPPIDLVYSLRP